MVLIPKENTDIQDIGLLEIKWKVVESVIDTRIKTVLKFHDVLHGIYTGRGSGTPILELKLAQELASVDQHPLFLVLLDLRKAYNRQDPGMMLQTLSGYRAVPKLRGSLTKFWLRREVFTRQNVFHGPPF